MANGHFTEDICTFVITSRGVSLGMRNFLDKIRIEIQYTHVMFNNVFQKSHRL